MTTTEKLILIRAHIVGLVEGAKKRTQGKWKVSDNGCTKESGGQPAFPGVRIAETNELLLDIYGNSEDVKANAAFIANCAGNAEAGWLCVMEEIDELIPMLNLHSWPYFERRAASIITAWEGLL